jgi:2-aminoadipate transaminase
MTDIWTGRFARRTQRITSSAVRDLLNLTEQPDFISFAGGLPAPEVFPVEEVAAAAEQVLVEHGSRVLQYGATEGYRPLREMIAARMSDAHVHVAVENVLITAGSQQALDLLGKVLVDAHDRIVVESPTYLAALQAWSIYEPEYLEAPSDDDGLRPSEVEPLLQQEPAFLYCQPNFQNPSGTTLTLERRQQLVALARRYGVPLVEDDPYHALRFEGEELPSLLSMAGAQCGHASVDEAGAVYIGTFSKTLAPGLRVGWVIGPRALLHKLAQMKQATDLHTGTFNQALVAQLMRDGVVERQAMRVSKLYRERRDVMLQALEEYFPAGMRWTRPQGGMFLWATLPKEIDTADLLRAAVEQKVAFVPGASFFPGGTPANTMRLNFSNAMPERIREGIKRLGALLHEAVDGGR